MRPHDLPGIGPFVVSSHSGGGNCVEVARPARGGAVVRDSKDLERGPLLMFGSACWGSFLDELRRPAAGA